MTAEDYPLKIAPGGFAAQKALTLTGAGPTKGLMGDGLL
jgi:hypothetical protein